MATAEEWKKYLESASGVSSGMVTANPFANAEGLAEEDEVTAELPFRFTQYQLNPQAEAAAGVSSRTPTARSPYASGTLAQELRGLESQLAGMGNVSDPGSAPTPPAFPSELENIPATQSELSAAPAPATPEMAYGMPLRSYEVPSGLLQGFTGNPLDLAIKYEAGMIPRQEGPTTSLAGYDIRGMIGEDAWTSLMTAKDRQRGSEQRLLYNLATLPTTFDPMLYKTAHVRNLANLDLTNPSRYNLEKNPEWTPESRDAGYDIPEYIPSNAPYSEDLARQQLYTNREDSSLNKVMQVALPTGLLAAMAAISGGAAGWAMGPAYGAAGGLGGTIAGSGTAGATAINAGAGIAASYGLSQGAEAAGIDTSHPMTRIVGAGVGGAAGGTISGATSATATTPEGGWTSENINAAIEMSAAEYGLSPDEFARQLSPNYTSSQELAADIAAVNAGGAAGTAANEASGFKLNPERIVFGGLEAGMAGYEATAPSNAGGIQTGLYDAGDINAYNEAYGLYESELGKYQEELDRFNKYNAMMEEYNTKMGKYENQFGDWRTQAGLFSNRQSALARKQGLRGEMLGNIAENPYYDQPENYAGIQQLFVA